MIVSHDQTDLAKMRNEEEWVRTKFGSLVDTVSRILFERDPIGLNFGGNTDEYNPEAATILMRIDQAATQEDLLRIIHEEFIRWFDAEIAGPESRYDQIAQDVWSAYRRAVPA